MVSVVAVAVAGCVGVCVVAVLVEMVMVAVLVAVLVVVGVAVTVVDESDNVPVAVVVEDVVMGYGTSCTKAHATK